MFAKRAFSSYFMNIVKVASGSIIGYGISVLSLPVVSRLFNQRDFGELSVWLSYVALISSIACLKYDYAIILPKNMIKAKRLFVASTLIAFSLLLISMSVWLIFKEYIKTISEVSRIMPYLFFMFPIMGIINALNFYNIRKERYWNYSTYKPARALLFFLFVILLSYFNFSTYNGLIIADILSLFCSIGFLFFGLKFSLSGLINIKGLRDVLVEYKNFPLFSVPSGIVENISGIVPAILFVQYVSLEFFGVYGLVAKVLGAPVVLVSRSIGDVFRREVSSEVSMGLSVVNTYKKTAKGIIVYGMLPLIILIPILAVFFETIFGSGWTDAPMILIVLLPMYCLKLLAQPLGNTYLIFDRQKIDFIVQLVLIIVLLISLISINHYFDKKITLIYCFSAVYTIKYIYDLFFVFRLIRRYEDSIS
jgi:O-antigen/teichoic acid export membrane protein